jgi:environmental stress-induced protein Ves
MRITKLQPSDYRRSPWKNGGGVTVDIAQASRPGHAPEDWAGMLWRFGRTAIVAPGPFSDLSGCDRIQVVVRGSGLVLALPDREIEVRRPWMPVRFRGEDRITTRLEDGPVEVVNLIADRAQFEIDLAVLSPGSQSRRASETHILYAAEGAASISISGERHNLQPDHALELDVADGAAEISHVAGTHLLLASIRRRA